ncbi:tyrosine-protein kinase Dnt [Anthonomus grandis grandis]|uniref:tyrosine-protein kinase Dnt n=1 Tax=Anthonomus grandis grandis TaxID=2921223 RepID=UPI0021667978|nr:tyrosine-protein kinase Dnt [Anthonomus grandis grandis]
MKAPIIFFCILLLNVMPYMRPCSAYVNLYLSSKEVQKLLGLPAEMYYIRNDEINWYALNFSLLIPPKVNDLFFTWECSEGQKVPYSVVIKISNDAAIPNFNLNIASHGFIPTTTQDFAISLPCSGKVEAEVYISIILNVTLSKDNTSTLIFLRKKTCLNEMGNDYVLLNTLPEIANSSSIFYIAMSCAAILIVILGILIIIYYLKDDKCKSTDGSGSAPTTTTTTTFLAALPRNGLNASCYGSFRRIPSYSLLNDDRSKNLQERIAELTIQRFKVHLNNIVMEGTFGRIYQGSYNNDNGSEEAVIIKTVADHASQVQISLLLQEGMSMYAVNHKHILSILRVSIEDHTPPFLLYPFNNNTNLKTFLQKCKVSSEGVHHTLTTQEVVHMALQIIKAMQHLHKKHLLHKDLAARNCVVDDKLNIQLADNALSRDLFPSDYHCLGDNENRPVKWLALESLLQKTFTAASDVWSFGVLLWELTTLAQQPYIEIDPFEVAAYLKDGYRLAQPINCPDELFAVMAYCWAMNAEERPTFTQLHVCLQEFYAQLTKYV